MLLMRTCSPYFPFLIETFAPQLVVSVNPNRLRLNMQTRHSLIEDIMALVCGAAFVAFGIFLFKTHGILTGGTAGIALIVSQVFNVKFGIVFFLINLPFYHLAWSQMGYRFALNTFISITTVSFLTENLGSAIHIADINPIFAGVFGGLLIGMGMLVLFRHKSSMGGSGILAFYLQERFNIRAGKFQMVVDCGVLLMSCFIADLTIVLISIAGAIMLNLIIAMNHKPGRYQIK